MLFRSNAWILDLVDRRAGIVVGGHVADAVARGLDRVHLHLRQIGQDVRHANFGMTGENMPIERGVAGFQLVVQLLAQAGPVGDAFPQGPRDVGRAGAEQRGVEVDVA